MNKNYQEIINELFQHVKEAWQEIRELCNGVHETIEEIEREHELRKTWYVPKNTTKCHQVLINKPLFSRIRNQI